MSSIQAAGSAAQTLCRMQAANSGQNDAGLPLLAFPAEL